MHSTAMAQAVNTKRGIKEKAGKEDKEKQEREGLYREYRKTLTQILSTLVRVQNEQNQTIQHSINSS